MTGSHKEVIAWALQSQPELAEALDTFLLKYQECVTYPSQQDIIREGLQLIVGQRVISELENMRMALRNLKENKNG